MNISLLLPITQLVLPVLVWAQTVDDLVLMTEEFPPYNFSEKGLVQGSSVEILELLLKKMNSRLSRKDIQVLPWARSYRTLSEQKNTVLFAMTRTEERERLFKWVGPISTAKNVLIALSSRSIIIKGPEEIFNYRIGTVKNDAGEQLVLSAGADPSKIEGVSSAIQNILKLKAQRIDLIAYDENVASWLTLQEGLNPRDFETVYVLNKGQHYFGFNLQTPDALIRDMQTALNEIRNSGEMDAIVKKYLK